MPVREKTNSPIAPTSRMSATISSAWAMVSIDSACPAPRRRLHATRHRPELDELLGRAGREEVRRESDESGPSRLMACAESGPAVAVEVLVEQEVIAPVRILLELP